MKKLICSMWLLMLSMVATAQTFVVVDKSGNRKTYDAGKIEKVTFQQTPPGFTIFDNSEQTNEEGQGEGGNVPTPTVTSYTFDKVQSFSGDPDFLFVHPDTVYVRADGQDFKFQLRTNVEYSYASSANWLLQIVTDNAATDSLSFSAGMNPSTKQRIGYIYFSCNNKSMLDTLVVVQGGKRDSRYIDINWDKTTLESYNKETGRAVLTFQDDVPVMGDHDVMLLPGTETYSIRLIDDVQQLSDTKVQLDTREGKMGNLFKDQQFALCSDPNYDPTDSGSSGGTTPKSGNAPAITGPIIYPESIELCENGRPVMEVYNRARRSTLEKEYNIFEYKYDNSGETIWEKDVNKVSWNTCTFDVGLKGIFYFDFGDTAWEDVRFGDLQNFKAYLDGDFNTDLILQYELSKGVEAKYEKTLKKDIFSYRVKFMVGTIPVWINLKSDLKASVEAKAEGTVAVTGGVRASANLKGGVEWDTNRGVNPISSFDYRYELVSPEVTAEAHAEAKAYVWPEINIGIYDVLCPTINPKPYIRAYADARTAEANKAFFGWNAGVSTGVDLTLGLNLDLYFWKKEIGEIDPINLIDRDLVAVPTKIELEGDTISRMLKGKTHEVKYTVKGFNRITGSEYNIPGALVKVESLGGGEIDKEEGYYYTNMAGQVVVKYTQSDTIPGYLKTTLITGDEERDKECRNWHSEIVDYRFTAVADGNSISATRAGKAEAMFLLEEYKKNKIDENGYWIDANGYTVKFSATGGKLEADSVITNGGKATANFDGGEDFNGGSVTATALIREFDMSYTQKLDIHKFSFEDAGLAKCYNLPNNTVLFDGEELPIAKKQNNFTRSFWKVYNETTQKMDTIRYPKHDRCMFSWAAKKTYNGSTVNKVWNHVSKVVQGKIGRMTPEYIFDIHDVDEVTSEDGYRYYTSAWDIPLLGESIETGIIDPYGNAYVARNIAVDVWQVDAKKWEDYAEEWRQKQIADKNLTDPEEIDKWKNYYKDLYPGHPDFPDFNSWTYGKDEPYHSGLACRHEEYGTGARNTTDAPIYMHTEEKSKGKQIIFEEGETYVYLIYQVMPNGDAIYVKVVFNKSEIDFYDKYTNH